MIDVAIVSLPRLDLTRPVIAPAILSSIVLQNKMTPKIFDVALEMYESCTKTEHEQYDLYWQLDLEHKLKSNHWQKLNELFDAFVKQVVDTQPKFIAISVFSHNSKLACDLLI